MTETISSNALIYAILSLNSEIELQKEYIDSPELSPEDKDEEEEILGDMEQAFMEFLGIYKARCRKDKTLPSIDELLTTKL